MNDYERGSAVITVVLVVLVLTMVGLAALIFMNLEQNLTLADRLTKEAFYMAETGMRQGERVIADTSLGDINALLSYPNTDSEIPSTMSECEGTTRLGAVLMDLGTGVVFHDTTPTFYVAPGGYYAVFTLHLRNNSDDPSGSPTSDTDNRVKLVSVGEVYRGGLPGTAGAILVARKILEEEMSTGVVTGYSGQKGGSPVGAGSGFRGM